MQETLKTLERLRGLVETQHANDGVWFDSRAWLVAARCA
jgi:hypothetical protein